MKHRALAFLVGVAFGLVGGMLLWRVRAVQTEEWKRFQIETARVRDTCLGSLSLARQQR